MFRKLIANLPYSPALIADIGFYAKRLRSEEITRRTTMLFVVLALIMQSLAVFSPPESANASSEQDIIHGGVSDLNDFLARYDQNEGDLKDIYNTVGVSRSEIAASRPGTIQANNNTYIMTRYGQLDSSDSEVGMTYLKSSGGADIRYFSPLEAMSKKGAKFNGWIGHSSIIGWFGIVKTNGGLVTHGLPATIQLDSTSATGGSKRIATINLSQDSRQAGSTTAKPLDKISYTLRITNTRSMSITTPFSVRLADALEYATLIDGGGGTFDTKSETLSWPQTQLAPGQSEERTFVIQLLSTIPSMSSGQSNPASYDCKMTLAFGNQSTVPVDCPPAKIMESLFSSLPTIGIGANIVFGASILLITLFFYIRTRHLKKEIRIIRHNFNAGTL